MLRNNINRRKFLKNALATGASSFVFGNILANSNLDIKQNNVYDIATVYGFDYYKSTIKAIELIGGINKIVKNNDIVGVIINSPWTKPGTYVNPDISLAVIKLCFDAGASQVFTLKNPSKEYWDKALNINELENVVNKINKSKNKTQIKLPKAKILKQAEVSKEFVDCDKFINIAIAKDHQGTRFTGILKNLMGVCTYSTCKKFHFKDGDSGDFYKDIQHLSRCIADLNTYRKPDLCVVDATEVIIKNGPEGPGDLLYPRKVIAGFDPVAVDAKASLAIGLDPDSILMIEYAEQLGLGSKYLSNFEMIDTNAD